MPLLLLLLVFTKPKHTLEQGSVQGAVLRFIYLHKRMVNLILMKKCKEMDNLLM
jgi:hypothetical protein